MIRSAAAGAAALFDRGNRKNTYSSIEIHHQRRITLCCDVSVAVFMKETQVAEDEKWRLQ
jgi:hypothetical protein